MRGIELWPITWAPRPARLRLVVVAALAAGVLASACAVGTDSVPQPIARQDVPFGLLKPTTPTSAPGPASEGITVFFEGLHHLVTVNPSVPEPVTLRSLLRALGAGPTSAESAAGVLSPVSTAAPLTLTSHTGDTVVVDVGTSFSALSGQNQIVAAAQLVYTLTLFPGVNQVVIRVGRQRTRMPTANGQISSGPLTRHAYANLAPL